MSRAHGLFLVLVLLASGSYAQASFSWAEKKDFQWQDFTGFPDDSSPFAANVNTGVSHRFRIDSTGRLVKGSSTITAYFYPKLSWYKPKQVNAGLLRHERLHFTITELHARIFRKQVAHFKFTTNARIEIKSIYRKIEQKRQKMQTELDRQTQHGLLDEKELIWKEKVNRLLAKY